jgi:hypothetical protein
VVVVNNRRDSEGCGDGGDGRIASYVPRLEFAVWIGAGFPTGDMKSRFNAKEYAANGDDGAIAGMGTDERIRFPAGGASIAGQSRAVPVEDEGRDDKAFTDPPKPIRIPMLVFPDPSVLSLSRAACEQQNKDQ